MSVNLVVGNPAQEIRQEGAGFSEEGRLPSQRSLATLCVEIGSTRIKAGVLEESASLQQLSCVHTFAIQSQDHVSAEKIPLLFKRDSTNPLHLGDAQYSKIAISISNPVSKGRFLGGMKDRLPDDLPALCRKDVDCEISFQNDSVCWASGAITFLKMKEQSVRFPALVITLGTFPGVAFCQDETSITDVEAGYLFAQCHFRRLITCALSLGYTGLVPGEDFFKWAFDGKSFEDSEVGPHLDSFNRLVQAFSEDMAEFVQEIFGAAPQSLLIGGGFSRFVQIPAHHVAAETYLLSPQYLQSENVSPDIIQLLGAKKIMEAGVQPDTYPSYEDIIEKRQARLEGRSPSMVSILGRYGMAMCQHAVSSLFQGLFGRKEPPSS